MDSNSSSSSSSNSPASTNHLVTNSIIKINGFSDPKLSSEPVVSRSRVAMTSTVNSQPKVVTGTAGYILEDVPHLTDYIPNLPVRRCFHQLQVFLYLISDHVLLILFCDFYLRLFLELLEYFVVLKTNDFFFSF